MRTVAATSEQSVLSFIANRSSFLIGELLLGKLSETVVVVGNAPHDRPGAPRFLLGVFLLWTGSPGLTPTT